MPMQAIRKPLPVLKKIILFLGNMTSPNNNPILIGPFSQVLTMANLPSHGPLHDADLHVIKDAGILMANGCILAIAHFDSLRQEAAAYIEIDFPAVALPGLIDAHTHLCWAGARYEDYAKRLEGLTYREIAAQGGGILDTVRHTRQASQVTLEQELLKRCSLLKSQGVTTCEAKSGYGLTVPDEIKILKAIRQANLKQTVELIPTCLAAHVCPAPFTNPTEYLTYLESQLFPVLLQEQLTKRMDIFIDEGFFTVEEARGYLQHAQAQGFQIVIHADQFSRGGAALAAELKALSADHLEMSTLQDFQNMQKNGVIPIVLPGCSLGMGRPMAPARQMLDCGLSVVIASDWNPGTAPMGYLLLQAAVMGMAQHLTMAETLAAITVRAARALQLTDRGQLRPGMRCDCAIYPCRDYREILYHQGSLKPARVLTAKEFGVKNE
jgi:imidazolonepropionase